MERIVAPTVRELQRRDIDYRGVLYAGIMLTSKGPKILEYNARFGDPETQALVPLYGDGLFDLLLSVGEGRLRTSSPGERAPRSRWCSRRTATRSHPRKGDVITGFGDDGQLAKPWRASRSFTPARPSTATGTS
jgi:phosphoribosylamine--glycine ligase